MRDNPPAALAAAALLAAAVLTAAYLSVHNPPPHAAPTRVTARTLAADPDLYAGAEVSFDVAAFERTADPSVLVYRPLVPGPPVVVCRFRREAPRAGRAVGVCRGRGGPAVVDDCRPE